MGARPIGPRPMASATRTLIPLEAVDPAMIEELLDRAFEPERKQRQQRPVVALVGIRRTLQRDTPTC